MSVTPWSRRPHAIEGTDRPQPLLYLLNGGETSRQAAAGQRAIAPPVCHCLLASSACRNPLQTHCLQASSGTRS